MLIPATLLAQTTTAVDSQWLRIALYILGAIGLFVVPMVLAHLIASGLRAKDMRRRLTIVLFTVIAAATVIGLRWHPKLGVDLRGGVILVYSVDLEASGFSTDVAESAEDGAAANGGRRDVDMQALVQAVSRRINPDGLKEIVVRPFGQNQIEIVIPQAEGAEIEDLKQKIATAGVLLFRIVANTTDHGDAIALAQAQADQPLQRLAHEVRDANGTLVARWVPVDREAAPETRRDDPNFVRPLKVDVSRDIIRDGRTGELIADVPTSAFNSDTRPKAFEEWLAQQGIEQVEVLMIEPEAEMLDVRGDYLGSVRTDYDPGTNRPCVSFTMKGPGIRRMQTLTSMNQPDVATGFHRRLGIILDNKLLSAPQIQSTIAERGQITGQFTLDEVRFLVGILQAGKLPAVLHQNPISQNQIGPLLGMQTIWQGSISIAVSLIVVLLFVWIYYRWAGMVACLALILNLVMTYALMILLGASLTLPGLAGLVLTVGMSVDANVLIYERIREEIRRGATLRMAIRNGFSRATTTIIDSNLTTLITGVVLYGIGTDQVRGFAVTLILGILMCMYTAIYFSRLMFDLAERRGWIKSLRMMEMIGQTNIDFLKYRWPAAIVSLILITAGIIAAVERGQRLLDIDFSGGSSVVMELEEPMSDAEVREKLATSFEGIEVAGVGAQYTLTQMRVAEKEENTIWKVDSSLTDVKQLQQVLEKGFDLVTYHMEFDSPVPVQLRDITERESEATDGNNATTETNAAPSTGDGDATGADPDGADTDRANTEGAGDTTPDESTQPQPDTDAAGQTEPTDAADASPDTGGADDTSTNEGATGEPNDDDSSLDTGEPSGEEEATGCQETPAVPQADTESAGDTTEQAETTTEGSDDAALQNDAAPQNEAAEPAETTAEDDAGPQDSRVDASATDTAGAVESEATDTQAEQTPPAENQSEPAANGGAAGIGSKSIARFSSPVSQSTLADLIEAARKELGLGYVSVVANPVRADRSGSGTSTEWELTLGAEAEDAERILEVVQQRIDSTPAWIQASIIGSQVAGDTRGKAIAAMLASFMGIIAYLWFRFHRIEFGLAAVLAVIHDGLVAVAFLAFSHYFVGLFGDVPMLGIDEFKISLPVVAAILTLVGYSLNDTIVIFDRLREIRGKSPELTSKMINDSVNQTLARTLLTAGTTLIVVLILYFVGGEGVHGFAFTLLIGLFAGTYSTVFIASPALLWMLKRDKTERVRTAESNRS